MPYSVKALPLFPPSLHPCHNNNHHQQAHEPAPDYLLPSILTHPNITPLQTTTTLRQTCKPCVRVSAAAHHAAAGQLTACAIWQCSEAWMVRLWRYNRGTSLHPMAVHKPASHGSAQARTAWKCTSSHSLAVHKLALYGVVCHEHTSTHAHEPSAVRGSKRAIRHTASCWCPSTCQPWQGGVKWWS
jgi:hypothetical protein